MSTREPIVVTGPTVEEAIKKGLAQLGVGPSQVIVEVLDEPARGIFGIGARQARVRLQPLVSTTSPAEPPTVREESPAPETETETPPTPSPESPVATDPEPNTTDTDDSDTKADVSIPEPRTEDPEPEPPATEVVSSSAPRVTDKTYDDDDFFDDEGNFLDEVEVLSRAKPSAGSSSSAFRRLSFRRPKPAAVEGEDAEEEPQSEPAETETKPGPTPRAEVQAVAETPDDVGDSSPDDDDEADDEADNMPVVDRRKRGPARFENFERRGRRYEDRADEDEDEADTDTVSEQPADDTTEADVAVVAQTGDVSTSDNGDAGEPAEAGDDQTLATQTLTEMMEIMGLDMVVEVARSQDDEDGNVSQPWILNLRGDTDTGMALVGEKGETLSALQFLTRLIVSKQTGERANVVVDVNDHRLRRTDKLADLANRMADEAVTNGRKVNMEPMPPHERRIVHMVLRRRGDVKTDSVGKGDKRRVTIIPKSGDAD